MGQLQTQPFLLDEDTLAFVRSAAEIIATAPSKPPVVIYQTAPAVVDFGNGVRDNARIAALNARAIKAVRDVLPGVLVLDLFAMTVDVARTRYADPTHFSVRVPSNAFKESDPPPPIIGSEAVLVLLHLRRPKHGGRCDCSWRREGREAAMCGESDPFPPAFARVGAVAACARLAAPALHVLFSAPRPPVLRASYCNERLFFSPMRERLSWFV
eukprot:Opistho-1_new@63573